MAAWYAGSAATLLIGATTSLYVTIASSLNAEGEKWLGYSIEYLMNYQKRTGHLPDVEDWPSDDFRIRDTSGGLIFETNTAKDRLPVTLIPDAPGITHRTTSGRWYRALSRRVGDRIYETSFDCTHELELLERYRRYMAIALFPALAASTVVGIVIARRGLKPLEGIKATARSIGPTRLNERIVDEGLPSELGDLARTFNVMLDRLQESFSRLERFSSDIAHELRTPVHAIRNVAEVSLNTSLTREDDREALAACLDSAEHLSRLIERLLFLARADNPRTVLELETFDLSKELTAIREFYVPAAEEAGIELTLDAPPSLTCHLDRTLFQRALGNILTNALTHTSKGGRVIVSASSDNGKITTSVADSGRGIASEHLPHIFDRFYRCDPARSSGQGVGLGLAIVKSIAELHGGHATIESRIDRGCVVTLTFPAMSHDENVI